METDSLLDKITSQTSQDKKSIFETAIEAIQILYEYVSSDIGWSVLPLTFNQITIITFPALDLI
jgi:hypothetical protein